MVLSKYLQATKETRQYKLTAPLATMSVESLVKGMKMCIESDLKNINQEFICDDNICKQWSRYGTFHNSRIDVL